MLVCCCWSLAAHLALSPVHLACGFGCKRLCCLRTDEHDLVLKLFFVRNPAATCLSAAFCPWLTSGCQHMYSYAGHGVPALWPAVLGRVHCGGHRLLAAAGTVRLLVRSPTRGSHALSFSQLTAVVRCVVAWRLAPAVASPHQPGGARWRGGAPSSTSASRWTWSSASAIVSSSCSRWR